ncbi:MAG: hypothetical protein OHK93_006452 [Ramalina farinacea]|uniref:Uncharacterized protein n=1 Tax=Ramalina farinacea TaxID=258253 RepID=A0AA43TTJ1_9LECA|nr:hypothetical protein [Ramalina farinacea]
MLRQQRDEKDAAARAALTSGDKRVAPESEQSNEGPVNKRPQTAPPSNEFPFKSIVPISSNRSMVWLNFGSDFRPLCGSLEGIPGVSVKVAVRAGRMGDPSVVLTMSVNKKDVSRKLSGVEAEVSRYELIWEPYIRTDDGYRVQSFIYASAEDKGAANAVPAAGEEILRVAKDNLGQVACIDMQVRGFRVSKPYEEEYWRGLEDSDVDAHRALEACVECFRTLKNSEKAWMHLKFWFLVPCAYAEWDRVCSSLFKQCVDQRRPYLHQYGLRKPLLDLNESPTFTQVGDGMYLTTNKSQGSSKILGQSAHLFDEALSFPTAQAAMTVYSLCPIRAAQHMKALSVFVDYQKCHVFLMPMASLAFVKYVMGEVHRPKHEDDPRTLLDNSFRALIRIPNVGGIKEGVLVPGMRFTLEFSNEAYVGEERELVRRHRPTTKGQHYHGTIVSSSAEELHFTGTTFAATLTKPRKAKAPQQSCLQNELRWLPDKDLVKAQIMVIPELNTQQQELNAVQKVWKGETEFVKTLRDRIWKEQAQLTPTKVVDLLEPESNMFDFEAHVKSLRTGKTRWNDKQQTGLRSLTRSPDGIPIIQGPPGTGKTHVLVEAVACLLRCNRKVQVVAPTNTSVDNVCTRIFERIQEWQELEDKIVLRVEVPSVMELDVLQRDAATFGNDIWENPEFERAMLHFIDQQLEERNTDVLDYLDKAAEEYKELTSKRRQKKDYPPQTTMGYNVRKVQYFDWVDVQKERDPKAAVPAFEDVTEDQYCAEPESKSYEYSKLARQIRQARGRPAGKIATQWQKARLAMVARVLKSASCVIMTPHVAGQLTTLTGFEADVVVVEEGGQMSVHSTMVAVAANSRTIKGLVLIGDHQQLKPVLIEGNVNEWGKNARLSLEELLYKKHHFYTMLTTSYRFHKELCLFPSKQFYGGRLQPDPYANPQNASRVAARAVSRELKIARPVGCEYVVVNAFRGVARPEVGGGTSLQNFASASAVIKVLGMLLGKGIPASDITILNLYKGQHGITQTKIIQKQNGETHFKKLGGISTIDAFQGKQSSIVLLDLVAAKDTQGGPQSQTLNAEQALGTKELISRFAREDNRINVAITRAQHALFVFCHALSIQQTSKVIRGEEQSCLVNLYTDAWKRGLVAEDPSEDDHPEAVKEREVAEDLREANQRQQDANIGKYGDIARDRAQQARRMQQMQQSQNPFMSKAPGPPKPRMDEGQPEPQDVDLTAPTGPADFSVEPIGDTTMVEKPQASAQDEDVEMQGLEHPTEGGDTATAATAQNPPKPKTKAETANKEAGETSKAAGNAGPSGKKKPKGGGRGGRGGGKAPIHS